MRWVQNVKLDTNNLRQIHQLLGSIDVRQRDYPGLFGRFFALPMTLDILGC
jgi:hypothetical protein